MILYHVGVTLLVIWFVMRGNTRVDYRLVALGAILPDLIDKPVGRILFRERFDSGRIFMHTLLINVALFSIVFFLRGRAKRQAALVPIASLLHVAEDGMWSHPQTFWWPLFGTEFDKDPVTGVSWLLPWSSSTVMIQEAIGLAALVWLFAAHGMLNRKGVLTFLRTGHLEPDRVAT